MGSKIRRNDFCRVCGGKSLEKVISLGKTPPANAFLKKEELGQKEDFFPLKVFFCKNCSFAQLIDIVSPELLFKNYVYVSSTSPSFVSHFKELSKTAISKLNLKQGTLVVDIGSNDGILLRPFKEKGM
ncbi:MAG: SAM-dependent methyltransferase, partial [archaeon]